MAPKGPTHRSPGERPGKPAGGSHEPRRGSSTAMAARVLGPSAGRDPLRRPSRARGARARFSEALRSRTRVVSSWRDFASKAPPPGSSRWRDDRAVNGVCATLGLPPPPAASQPGLAGGGRGGEGFRQVARKAHHGPTGTSPAVAEEGRMKRPCSRTGAGCRWGGHTLHFWSVHVACEAPAQHLRMRHDGMELRLGVSQRLVSHVFAQATVP